MTEKLQPREIIQHLNWNSSEAQLKLQAELLMTAFPPQAVLEPAVLGVCADLLVPADSPGAAGALLHQQLPCSLTALLPLWPGLCKSACKATFPPHMIYLLPC